MLRFHNTLSGRVEEFHPMKEGEVRFYYCGPTVWEYGHIGNFRSAVAADIVRRYLKFKGYKVTHVMNITDVDDRIIAKSQEAGLRIDDYTAKYIDALWEDFDALGCERPEIVPRATRHIPEMDRDTRTGQWPRGMLVQLEGRTIWSEITDIGLAPYITLGATTDAEIRIQRTER